MVESLRKNVWVDTDSKIFLSKDRAFLQIVIVGKTPGEDRLYSVEVASVFDVISTKEKEVFLNRFVRESSNVQV
jgi:hypothetical protein